MSETKTKTDFQLPAIIADQSKIAEIKSTIQIKDRAEITRFGDRAQSSVTSYADKILAQTKNKDMGETGKLLSEILMKAKGLDPASLKNEGLFGKMFGGMRAKLQKFKMEFEDVASQIDSIAIELMKRKDGLRRDIAMLDGLHEQTKTSIIDLDAHIEAGKQYVEEFKTTQLPAMKQAADQAAADGNEGVALMAAQAYQDAVQALDRLEKRVFYLQQARQIGIQQLPQIRIVQSGDETLIENLQASTTLTIPVWKQKMVLLLGLANQKGALELQQAVTDATNEMMRQASGMMREQAIEIEKQSQRGIVDMETLEQTNRDLIETIQGVVAAQEEGRQKRAEAEKRMEQLTEELRTTLIEAQR